MLIHDLAAQGRSLREIGAEVGVSHETVRAVIRAETASKAERCGESPGVMA